MQQSMTDERSLGELFGELAQDTRTLISQELELAKAEYSQKASKAGKGVGVAAAGGLVAYAGLFFILAGIVLALAEVVPAWLAALLVGVIVVAVGYLVLQKGLGDVKSTNLKPEKTIAGVKEDKQYVQERVR